MRIEWGFACVWGFRGESSMKTAARKSPDSGNLELRRGHQLGVALRSAYASVLNEPCPQNMLDLLDELRAKEHPRKKA